MKKPQLLTRTQGREACFARDNHTCVCCPEPAVDAHHILERRLFRAPEELGGYYVENLASVCERHHRQAEMTLISPEELREKAGITTPIVPSHLYPEYTYDKWANIILENGRRIPGELFWDESVQNVLKQGDVLKDFDLHYRYPRTMHLPHSAYVGDDDKIISSLDVFKNNEVVVTIKMDGEATTINADGHVHARSPESASHPSQTWVRNLGAKISHELDPGFRLCGENMYATHSIQYRNLDSYFYLYSVWDNKNNCLSWDDTELWAKVLDIPTVPVIYRGPYDEKIIQKSFDDYKASQHDIEQEGYVIRTSDGFAYSQFQSHVAKWVRPAHQKETIHNWKSSWYASDENINHLKKREHTR